MGAQTPTEHLTPVGMPTLFQGRLFVAPSEASKWTDYDDNMTTEQLYRLFLAAADKSCGFQIARRFTGTLLEMETEI
jgi:hypothetical protein